MMHLSAPLSALAVLLGSQVLEFNVIDLDTPNPERFGHFAWSVSGAGDVNNDGKPDLLVGAPFEDAIVAGEGRVYIFSGADGTLLRTLISPNAAPNGQFGISVSGVGDVNDDGHADVLVGAWREDFVTFGAGRAYIFSGADGSVLQSLTSPNPESNARFGSSVSESGDVDGDGITDAVVGALSESGGADRAGRAYVFSGADGDLLHTLISPNPETDGNFGNAVSGAGDVDGDQTDDVLVAASSEDGGGIINAGRAYVFSGADGSLLHTLDSPNPDGSGSFGTFVSGAGRVDDDGNADVVVGAPWEDEPGRAYVFSGTDGGLIHTLVSPDPELQGGLGWAVSGVGDMNGDGRDDLLVAAHREDAGEVDAGRIYIFSGADGSVLHSLASSNPEVNGLFGYSASDAGDVNGDGVTDLLVGGFFEDGGEIDSGRAHVFVTLLPPREVSPPGAAQALVWTDRLTLVWQDAAINFADTFNLYRGTLVALDGASWSSCHESNIPSNSTMEPTAPLPGAGWGYLVTAVNAVGEGPLGQASDGTPRTPVFSCP